MPSQASTLNLLFQFERQMNVAVFDHITAWLDSTQVIPSGSLEVMKAHSTSISTQLGAGVEESLGLVTSGDIVSREITAFDFAVEVTIDSHLLRNNAAGDGPADF